MVKVYEFSKEILNNEFFIKIIYTTNTIENLNRNIRKITKTKGSFTTQTSLVKLIYLRLVNIQEDWTKRSVHNWPLAI